MSSFQELGNHFIIEQHQEFNKSFIYNILLKGRGGGAMQTSLNQLHLKTEFQDENLPKKDKFVESRPLSKFINLRLVLFRQPAAESAKT